MSKPSSPMTVALTGSTGFVGSHILRYLLEQGHTARVLVRDPAKLGKTDTRLTPIKGDLFQNQALDELVRGVDAVIHVVGIIEEQPAKGQTFERIHMEGTQHLVAAAKRANVRRWIQMSALGSRPDAVARYHSTKWQAEQAVRESGLAWTIFRPSIIHGPDGEFMQMVRDFWCKPFPPFVPFFSRETSTVDIIQIKTAVLWPFPSLRRYNQPRFVSRCTAGRLQPVFVDDVARCFVDALHLDQSIGEVYPLGGPRAMTWQELYTTIRPHLVNARAKKVCGIPAWYARMIAGMPGVPFNRDQVIMSQEESTCDIGKVESDFGFQLASLEACLDEYGSKLTA